MLQSVVVRQLVFGALMWGTCLYAVYRGGRSEKIVAGGIIANVYLTVLVSSPFAHRFQTVELPIAIVDTALLMLLLSIALTSRKFWPLWLTAMQALGTLSHLAPLVPHVIPWAYGNAVALWMYPMLIVLGLATRRQHLRQNQARYRQSAAP